jgi:ATP-dependent DNA helicase RecQ
MPQFHAGYVIDELYHLLAETNEDKHLLNEIISGLLNALSHFELESPFTYNKVTAPDPVFCVADKLISRGLPTKASVFLTSTLLSHSGLLKGVERQETLGNIFFKFDEIADSLKTALFNSLHIVDPRIKASDKSVSKTWEDHGSEFETSFLSTTLPTLGMECIVQLLETQKDFEKILRFGNSENEGVDKYIKGTISNFLHQEVDFSISFPYLVGKKLPSPTTPAEPGYRGVVIEIDGSQHDLGLQRETDEKRDDAVKKAGWYATQRLKTRDFTSPAKSLTGLLDLMSQAKVYCHRIKTNFKEPLYNKGEEGMEAMQLMLTPIAVARIEKCILHCLSNEVIGLNDEVWRIVVIERDVPCANLAIEDLKQLLSHLLALEGKGRKLPEIKLSIRCTKEFINAPLHALSKDGEVSILNENESFADADLILDVAVLARKGYYPTKIGVSDNTPYLFIRSAYSVSDNRKFCTAAPISYKPILYIPEDEDSEVYDLFQVRSLEYFLQTIFRKAHFREGQLPILNRGLQYKSVLGLLPTGGGKSLTYQLAALLQPGTTLVIDPIKSLMQDQYDNLLKSKIDAVTFINSTIKSSIVRKYRMSQLISGELLFCFISPERLQIQTFRAELADMHHLHQQFFNFCVIDEAHCVSEWGHDFRTSYLRLGDNIRQHCLTSSGEEIPVYGLTATASFDVLADVERELKLEADAVVRSETTERPELNFIVRDVNTQDIPSDERNPVGAQKHHLIQEIIKYDIGKRLKELQLKDSTPKVFAAKDISGFYKPDARGRHENAGLIFCPYKKATTYEGVMRVHSMLSSLVEPALKVGYFMGGDDIEDSSGVASESAENQTKFVSDRLSVLAATKAFGMGIDKPNIRYTIHLNYPNSIEAFYQEAGRAGRDRNPALNYVLYHSKKQLSNGGVYDPDKNLLESFHSNSFKGEKKEKTILYELLTKITFPYKDSNSSIGAHLRQELDIEAKPFIYRGNRSKRIDEPWVLIIGGENGDSYGWINFKDPDHISIDTSRKQGTVTHELADKVLRETKKFIEENCADQSSRKAIEEWLSLRSPEPSADGIEVLLKKARKIRKVLPPIYIGFRGSAINEIVELLKQQNKGVQIGEHLILDAYGFCKSEGEFLDNVQKEYIRQSGDRGGLLIPDKLKKTIGGLFWKIRDSSDTFKAIHRLTTVGVIDDYEVDYGKELIIVHLVKKDEEHYLKSLFEYVSRYFSHVRATKEVMEEVPLRQGNTMIQKCLGYLVEFTYKQIADKRLKAINSMVDACEEGLHKGSEEMKQFIHLYFNSMYARQEYLPTDTEEGRVASFDIIFKYLEYVKNSPVRLGLVTEIDNVKHLRGACVRMLGASPDNSALLYLNAFCIFFLELNKPFQKPNVRMLSDGIDLLVKGYYNFFEHEGMTPEKLQFNTENYIKICSGFNSTLAKYIKDEVMPVLELRRHLMWLREFNNRMKDKPVNTIENEPELAERIA